MTGPHAVSHDSNAVTRRVRVDLASVEHVLDMFGQTTEQLRIDAPFVQRPGTLALWRATGRLYDRGLPFARSTRVELELTAWSHRATELRICPLSRRVRNWGAGRRRRYFDLAHEVIDRLVPSLERAVRHHELRVSAAQSMRPVVSVDKSA